MGLTYPSREGSGRIRLSKHDFSPLGGRAHSKYTFFGARPARSNIADKKNTIVKCVPLHCYRKTFFTDRVSESYLRRTAVKSRGKDTATLVPPWIVAPPRPPTHTPKVDITEWRLCASESCPKSRIWCRVTSASSRISCCTILDLRFLVRQALSGANFVSVLRRLVILFWKARR